MIGKFDFIDKIPIKTFGIPRFHQSSIHKNVFRSNYLATWQGLDPLTNENPFFASHGENAVPVLAIRLLLELTLLGV